MDERDYAREFSRKGGIARAAKLSKARQREIAIKASKAAAKALSPERRREIARAAARARWKNHAKTLNSKKAPKAPKAR